MACPRLRPKSNLFWWINRRKLVAVDLEAIVVGEVVIVEVVAIVASVNGDAWAVGIVALEGKIANGGIDHGANKVDEEVLHGVDDANVQIAARNNHRFTAGGVDDGLGNIAHVDDLLGIVGI